MRANNGDKFPVSGPHRGPGGKDDEVLEDRRAAFCARLKGTRERTGISLEDIAASTKISRSLLKALEDGDVSRWPQGIYRRSYLRNYLRAIDLPADSIVADFVRLFPDEDSVVKKEVAEPEPEESCPFAMTLAMEPAEKFHQARRRIAAATIDLGVVLIASGAAWWAMRADVWMIATSVALAYYSLGTAALGRSVGSRCLEDRSWRRRKGSASAAASPDTLFAQLREIKGLPGEPSPSMIRRFASVAFNAALFRILFFR
jgi:transcriptional regulator with XRE-family HTH domain